MILFYEDETHIRDYQALHTSWFLRGKQKQIPTYGRHASVTLFGAVNMSNGYLHCMEATACNATAFQEFLQYVVKENPHKHIVMVLDNARIHHAKLLKPFLRKNSQRLTLIFLPPYSPNLNLLERIWKWLKESVISNRFHASQEEIRTSVLSFLEYIAQWPEKVLKRLGVEQLLKY
ncbi:IS630 family transposase [Bacillus thuringiensis serovar yunnanensis]|nr:IS630 family transposase [Bacillus thuringiensis serovar yunnanensis]OUB14165.1 IS630 family transposase [Bacillus thuringiensis serovar yunnanensis]OUB14242.1 IS630 family transposase [Bacillus thuringiensis serovar yunnanensis]OUB34139.1 IS630 family transposase [Bacillus thuringiensis serovar yunnanensis]